jgi:hypothetical protein
VTKSPSVESVLDAVILSSLIRKFPFPWCLHETRASPEDRAEAVAGLAGNRVREQCAIPLTKSPLAFSRVLLSIGRSCAHVFTLNRFPALCRIFSGGLSFSSVLLPSQPTLPSSVKDAPLPALLSCPTDTPGPLAYRRR